MQRPDREDREDRTPSLTDLCQFDADGVRALRRELEDTPPGAAAATVLVTAPCGMGLTSLLTRLLRDLDFDVVWVGAGTQRLKSLLHDALRAPGISVTGARKVVVVDELDAVLADPAAASEVLAFLRARRRVPVVAAGHPTQQAARLEAELAKPGRKGEPPARAARVRFEAPAPEVTARGRRGAFPALRDDDLEALATAAPAGDVRACLATARLWQHGARAAPTREVRPEEGLHAANALLRDALPVREVLRRHGTDSAARLAMHENYLGATTSRRATCEHAARVAAWFSDVDVIERANADEESGNAGWTEPFAAALALAGPALLLAAAGGDPPAPSDKQGTLWSKEYNRCAKAKATRRVIWNARANGASDMSVEGLHGLRKVLAGLIARGDAEGLLGVGLREADVLAVMRLHRTASEGASAAKDGEYTQSVHNRVKRWLQPLEPPPPPRARKVARR